MRIYLAASIRGGREDVGVYTEIAAHLESFGELLTEQVADRSLAATGEGDGTDPEIHARDMAWLSACDAVVAEVSTPSLGVGYELAISEKLGKPVLCLFRPDAGRRLSAMIAGNPSLDVREYRTIEQARAHIDRFLGRVDEAASEEKPWAAKAGESSPRS